MHFRNSCPTTSVIRWKLQHFNKFRQTSVLWFGKYIVIWVRRRNKLKNHRSKHDYYPTNCSNTNANEAYSNAFTFCTFHKKLVVTSIGQRVATAASSRCSSRALCHTVNQWSLFSNEQIGQIKNCRFECFKITTTAIIFTH